MLAAMTANRVGCKGLGGLLLSLLVFSAAPAIGQTCPGDCDGNKTVSVAELIRGVDIALGAQAVAACRASDANNDGAVTVDELVNGVDRALFGCAGGRDSTVRATSSVAVSSVFSLLDFGQIAGGGGGGASFGGLPRMIRSASRATQISGCQTLECFAFGVFTGTEEVCCFFNRVEITDAQCTTDDGFGNVTERSGFSAFESSDFDPCALEIPPGNSFSSEFTDYSLSIHDPFGNFFVLAANAFESFEANPGGCAQEQRDPFALGAGGDGIRTTDGTMRQIVGNAGGVIADLSTTSSGLSLDIFSSPNDGGACVVDVEVNGEIAVSDFLGGEQFSQAFDTFFLTETPLPDGDALLDLDGFTTSDCLGGVYMFTREPLRLALNSQCPTGGVLELSLSDESVGTIGYTTLGGLEFDFDDDGTIDQRLNSCEDLELQQCGLETPQDQCAPCDLSGSFECGSELVCAPCLTCEGAPSRCAPPGDFAICEDDIFGQFGF